MRWRVALVVGAILLAPAALGEAARATEEAGACPVTSLSDVDAFVCEYRVRMSVELGPCDAEDRCLVTQRLEASVVGNFTSTVRASLSLDEGPTRSCAKEKAPGVVARCDLVEERRILLPEGGCLTAAFSFRGDASLSTRVGPVLLAQVERAPVWTLCREGASLVPA